MTTTAVRDVPNAARQVRAGGVSIIPTNATNKRPDGRLLPKERRGDGKDYAVWSPFQKDIVSADVLERDWIARGLECIAAVGGKVSGGAEFLDFETAAAYAAWRVSVGPLADDLFVQRSPGGGYHVGYRYKSDNPEGNQKLAWALNPEAESGREILIETRGEGGYIMLAPSTHPNGGRYEVVQGDPANLPLIAPAVRDALIAAARKLCQAPFTKQEMALRERMAKEASEAHRRKVQARAGQQSPIELFKRDNPIEQVLDAYRYVYDPHSGYYVRPDGNNPSVKVMDGRSFHFSADDTLCDHKVRQGLGVHDAFDLFVHHEHGGDFNAAVKAAARMYDLNKPTGTGTGGRSGGEGADSSLSPSPTPAPVYRPEEPDGVHQETPRRRPIPAYQPHPLALYPKVIRAHIQHGAAAIGCYPEFIVSSAMASVGVAIGNSRRVRITKKWREPAVIWAGTIAESGDNKTAPFDYGIEPLRRIEALWRKEHNDAMRGYKVAKAEHERDMAAWRRKSSGIAPPPEEPVEPTRRRATYDNTTVEAIPVRLRENPRGGCLADDEVSGNWDGMDQYKGGKGNDVQTYLKMWQAGPLQVDRKQKGEDGSLFIPRAFLAKCGNVQPGAVASCMPQKNRENGYLARWLFHMPPRRDPQWPKDYQEDRSSEVFGEMLKRLFALHPDIDPETQEETPKDMPLTDDAFGLFRGFWEEQTAAAAAAGDRHMRSHYFKLVSYCARFSLIFQCARSVSEAGASADEIDAQSMGAAIELARWYRNEAGRVYTAFREDEKQREVRELAETLYQKFGTSEIRPRDVQGSVRRFRKSSEDAARALGDMVRGGFGQWHQPERDDGPGRPPERYFRFHPHVWDDSGSVSGNSNPFFGEESGISLTDGPGEASVTVVPLPEEIEAVFGPQDDRE